MDFQVVSNYSCDTGEGPIWEHRAERLYWIEIYGGVLYSYDPATETSEIVYEDDILGGFTYQSDGSILLFGEAGAIERLGDGATETVVDEVPSDSHTRYNDCIADPRGRVFCGTKGTDDGPGRLYRLDTDGTLTLIEDELGLSNGLGFTPDTDALYHTDSSAAVIYRYDYDVASGTLSNQHVFADLGEEPGIPDGLTVDAEGHVWSAQYGGGRLLRLAPDGEIVRRLDLPVPQVTSVTFGGPALRTLYVTTGGGADSSADPLAGALFRSEAPVAGEQEFYSAV